MTERDTVSLEHSVRERDILTQTFSQLEIETDTVRGRDTVSLKHSMTEKHTGFTQTFSQRETQSHSNIQLEKETFSLKHSVTDRDTV